MDQIPPCCAVKSGPWPCSESGPTVGSRRPDPGARALTEVPPGEQVPEAVARAVAAANANDIGAFLASFTPDGVVDDWGREFTGPDAIRGWSDREFIARKVSLEIRAITQDGNATTITAQVGGEGFNGPSHFTFLVEDGRVARMTIRA
jgi:hypothetical protein